MSQDIEHLFIRYKTSNAFGTKHFDCSNAASDIQQNLKPFKETQRINEHQQNRYDPYTLMQLDNKNFDNIDSINLAKYTIKNHLQLKSM